MANKSLENGSEFRI